MKADMDRQKIIESLDTVLKQIHVLRIEIVRNNNQAKRLQVDFETLERVYMEEVTKVVKEIGE